VVVVIPTEVGAEGNRTSLIEPGDEGIGLAAKDGLNRDG
jgi:hypothetical protein